MKCSVVAACSVFLIFCFSRLLWLSPSSLGIKTQEGPPGKLISSQLVKAWVSSDTHFLFLFSPQAYIFQTETWGYILLGDLVFRISERKGLATRPVWRQEGNYCRFICRRSFAPGIKPQPRILPSAMQGVILASGLVGTSESSCWFCLLTCGQRRPNI